VSPPLLMDACVLIDFVRGGRYVLELAAKYIGPVHVIKPIVDEVREIENEDELVELGVMVIDPELIDAFAASSVAGPTSFQDRLCVLTAKRLSCTCVTNDKQLRKYCAKEGVAIWWGLQVLLELHKCGGIPVADAIEVARRISDSNPRHVNAQIVEKFIREMKAGESPHAR